MTGEPAPHAAVTAVPDAEFALLILGKRIRHYRAAANLTLGEVGAAIGTTPSVLSLIENGKREPKVSMLQQLASIFDVSLAELIETRAPDARAQLEIDVEFAQRSPVFAALGITPIRALKSLPTEALDAIRRLHGEIERQNRQAIATPEEARRTNTAISRRMRARNNHIAEIESAASDLLTTINHTVGAITHREVALMAQHLGFTLIHVDDLPHSTRSVTDIANHRIYLPPASIPGGHGLRSLALQAMAHRVLGHRKPTSYAEFLQQRLEINYFAAACLMPLEPATAFLRTAKKERNLAIEDFRDAFGVTHEAAAHRFTNLATEQLGLRVHFLRTTKDGALLRGYENDGLPLPTDQAGTIEGQIVCKKWAARTAFERTNRTTEYYQYTDTPAGTFWSSVQTGSAETETFSITVGVAFDDAKWFRGRDTRLHTASACPDVSCCRRPDPELAARWSGQAWPSAKMHAHILSPLPQGSFPGVDDAEVYEFLSRHAES